MIGEFIDKKNNYYAMIVNLSLERSALIKPSLIQENAQVEAVSPEDGTFHLLDLSTGFWLVPGQGILLRLKKTDSVKPENP